MIYSGHIKRKYIVGTEILRGKVKNTNKISVVKSEKKTKFGRYRRDIKTKCNKAESLFCTFPDLLLINYPTASRLMLHNLRS